VRRVAALLAAVVAMMLALVPGPLGAQTDSDQPRIYLTSQNAWLAPGDDLMLGLRVDAAGVDPSTLGVAVTICQRILTRSEFALTLQDNRIACSERQFLPPVSIATLPIGADGNLELRLPLGDGVKEQGVYPVRVELRPKVGRAYDHFTTHLVLAGPAGTNLKLGAAFVLPFSDPSLTQPSQERSKPKLDPATSARLSALVSAMASHPTVPLTVRPSGPTLEALAAGAQPTDGATLEALATESQTIATRQMLGGPYAPVDTTAMLADGLASELTAQIARNDDVTSTLLKVRPDPRSWVADDTIGQAGVTALSDRGVDRVVLPEASLVPINQGLTPTQPFLVEPVPGRQLTATTADAGLAAHFAPTDDPVLTAHQLLADLAVVYFDAPGSRANRAVAAVPPLSWEADPTFVNTVLDGLATSPIITGVTLDGLFSVPLAQSGTRRNQVRVLATVPPTADRAMSGASIRAVRRRIEAFGSFLDRDNQTAADLFDDIDRSLLLTESTDLRSRQRESAVDAVNRRITQQLALVRLSNTTSVRLTARSGEIPVTVVSEAPYPVHVIVRLQSDKLLFPHGADRPVDINRRNTTSTFTVDARSSGAFPVRVSLESPGGGLTVGSRRFTVRSTAASNVGLVLSVGAGLFLIIWWGRNIRHGRRARRLVPA
jgi:hypothetical protein